MLLHLLMVPHRCDPLTAQVAAADFLNARDHLRLGLPVPVWDKCPGEKRSPLSLNPSNSLVSDVVDFCVPFASQVASEDLLDGSSSQVGSLVFDSFLKEHLKPDVVQLLEQPILLHNGEPKPEVLLIRLNQLLLLNVLLRVHSDFFCLPMLAEQLFFEPLLLFSLKSQKVLLEWVFNSVSYDTIVVVLSRHHLVPVISERMMLTSDLFRR